MGVVQTHPHRRIYKEKKKPKLPSVCALCKKEFNKTPQLKYCSKECRVTSRVMEDVKLLALDELDTTTRIRYERVAKAQGYTTTTNVNGKQQKIGQLPTTMIKKETVLSVKTLCHWVNVFIAQTNVIKNSS